MRGLKHTGVSIDVCVSAVALPTSAWIETICRKRSGGFCYVALPTSAWIETLSYMAVAEIIDVALPTSAWIETLLVMTGAVYLQTSHSLRVRGLKLADVSGSLNNLCRTPYECVD